AQLHPHARHGGLGEVGRHDRRRATVEGERRDEHAPVANRHQFGHTTLGLAFEDRHGILAVLRGLPFGVAGAGRVCPRVLAFGFASVGGLGVAHVSLLGFSSGSRLGAEDGGVGLVSLGLGVGAWPAGGAGFGGVPAGGAWSTGTLGGGGDP